MQPSQQQAQQGPAEEGQDPAPAAPEAKARNAFEVLARAQRVLQQVHVAFLERQLDGSFHVHWWLKGDQEAPQRLAPAWSGSTGLSLGRGNGGGKAPGVQVLLQTNVPSGDGADVSWDNPALANNPSGGRGAAPGAVGSRGSGPYSTAACTGGGTTFLAASASSAAAAPPGLRARAEQRKGLSSLLKSALQKNVRLCRPEAAVRVATAFLKEDPSDFLRRLAIICVEDAVLHPQLPLVCWCMAAHSKGYQVGGTLANALLAVVQQLAACPIRDFVPRNTGLWRTPASLSAVDEQLPPCEAGLVKSVMLRAAFGGMKCDTELLWGYAGYWTARFLALAAPPPPLHQLPHHAQQQQQQQQEQQKRKQQKGAPPKLEGQLGMRDAAGPTAVACGAGDAGVGHVPQPEQQQQQQQEQQQERQPPSMPFQIQDVVAQGDSFSGAAAAASSGEAPWPSFLAACFASGGARAPKVTLVGPLQRDDIPLSAVDFHISDVVPFLLGQPPVQAVLAHMTKACWGADADRENLLRSCIWQHRSGVNTKRFLLELHEGGPHHQASPSHQGSQGMGVGEQQAQQLLAATQKLQAATQQVDIAAADPGQQPTTSAAAGQPEQQALGRPAAAPVQAQQRSCATEERVQQEQTQTQQQTQALPHQTQQTQVRSEQQQQQQQPPTQPDWQSPDVDGSDQDDRPIARPVPQQPGGPAGGPASAWGSLSHERYALKYDLETDEAERQRLAALWQAVRPLADRYSAARIGERLASSGLLA